MAYLPWDCKQPPADLGSTDERRYLTDMTSIYLAIMQFIQFIHRDDEGQGLAEYALILALIAVVAIVTLFFLGSQISSKLSVVGNQL